MFIKGLAGPDHGWLDAGFAAGIDFWIMNNGLSRVLGKIDGGGKSYQPDKAYRPHKRDLLHPDCDVDPNLENRAQPRLVIETERYNRSGRGLREIGFAAMQNKYTRLFHWDQALVKGHNIWQLCRSCCFVGKGQQQCHHC